jgi:hypothetical protein
MNKEKELSFLIQNKVRVLFTKINFCGSKAILTPSCAHSSNIQRRSTKIIGKILKKRESSKRRN